MPMSQSASAQGSDATHEDVLQTLANSVSQIKRKSKVEGLDPETISTLASLSQVLSSVDYKDEDPAEAALGRFANERDLFEFDDLIQKRAAFKTWTEWHSKRSAPDRTEDTRDICRGVPGADEIGSMHFLVDTAYYLAKELGETNQSSKVLDILTELQQSSTVWLQEVQRWAREESDGQELFPKGPKITVTGV